MHPHIESYLTQVGQHLRRLSTTERAEELREIEQHLQALVEQGQERGLNQNEAIKTALSQFGSSRKVGRELNKAVLQRDQAQGKLHQLPKSLSALTLIMMVQAVFNVLIMGFLMTSEAWAMFVQTVGGPGRGIVFIIMTLCFNAIPICLALSLRRFHTWAFWLALVFLSWQSVVSATQLLRFFTPPYTMTNIALNFLPTLYCLFALLVSRKSYFLRART